MRFYEEFPEEFAQLWDQYQNDPRPFPEICAEHFVKPSLVFDGFRRAGIDYKSIKRPMTCVHCGTVFVQDHINQRYCSDMCKKIAKAVQDSQSQTRRIEAKKSIRAKKINKSIKDLATEAREHGMTYGQYVAHLEGR